jgi:hypothetical protein
LMYEFRGRLSSIFVSTIFLLSITISIAEIYCLLVKLISVETYCIQYI